MIRQLFCGIDTLALGREADRSYKLKVLGGPTFFVNLFLQPLLLLLLLIVLSSENFGSLPPPPYAVMAGIGPETLGSHELYSCVFRQPALQSGQCICMFVDAFQANFNSCIAVVNSIQVQW